MASMIAPNTGKFILPENVEEEAVIKKILLYKQSTCKTLIYYIFCVLTLGILALLAKWKPSIRIFCKYFASESQEADLLVIYGDDGTIEYIESKRKSILHEGQLQERTVFEYRFYIYYLETTENVYKPVQFLLKNKTYTDIINEMGLGLQNREHLNQRIATYGLNLTDIPMKTNTSIIIDEILSPFYLFQIFSCVLWGFFESYYIYASVIFTISIGTVITSFITIKKNYVKLYKQAHLEIQVIVYRNFNSEERILGKPIVTSSANLVPGDVIEIPDNETMPCDIILLSGTAIMNEGMLTGESIPIIKQSLPKNERIFDPDNDSKYIIYSGTKCLETRRNKGTNSPVLGVVFNTGFATMKGRLVRSLVFPKPEYFKFYKDAITFIGIMGIFAFGLFIYTIINMIMMEATTEELVLRALDTITIAVPPALATCMSIGAEIAVERLEKQNIITKSHNKINVAGRVDMMCFDKTGTLTEDSLDLYGVRCVSATDKSFSPIVRKNFYRNLNEAEGGKDRKGPSQKMLETMVSCHCLTHLKKNLSGDPLDLKMFNAAGWTLIENVEEAECMVKSPDEKFNGYFAPNTNLKVIKRFEFAAKLQRMSVIVQDAKEDTSRLYVKGSPEKLKELCSEQSLPRDFDEILLQYTQSGLRVLACATKSMDRKINFRDEVEREDFEKNLEFLGFMIFQNKLKQATPIGIAKLRYAKIPSIMITGDNVLTAICVARDCGIISVGQKIVLAEMKSSENEQEKKIVYRYVDLMSMNEKLPDDNIILDVKEDKNIQVELIEFPKNDKQEFISKLESSSTTEDYSSSMVDTDIIETISTSEVSIAVTGEALNHLKKNAQHDPFFKTLLKKTKVFARMKPEEKAQVVEELQKKGFIVGMCGDGANDCPALKQANIGVSLSEAEASIAAPFLSKIPDISSIDIVLREGRAGLVTSFQCFKYMALYSVVQSVSVVTLYAQRSSLTDPSFLYIDLFLILPLAITMSATQANEILSPRQPVSRLISVPVLSSIIGQVFIQGIYQLIMGFIQRSQSWYVSSENLHPNPEDYQDYNSSYDSTTIFLFSNFQYIATVLAFSIGRPFRKDFYTNTKFTATLVLGILTSSFLVFNNSASIAELLGLLIYPNYDFVFLIFGLAASNFLLTLFYERKMVPIFVKKWSKNPHKTF